MAVVWVFFPHATSFFSRPPPPPRTGRVEGRGGGPKHLTILLRSRKEKKSKEREGGYGDSKGGICGLLKVRKRDPSGIGRRLGGLALCKLCLKSLCYKA